MLKYAAIITTIALSVSAIHGAEEPDEQSSKPSPFTVQPAPQFLHKHINIINRSEFAILIKWHCKGKKQERFMGKPVESSYETHEEYHVRPNAAIILTQPDFGILIDKATGLPYRSVEYTTSETTLTVTTTPRNDIATLNNPYALGIAANIIKYTQGKLTIEQQYGELQT